MSFDDLETPQARYLFGVDSVMETTRFFLDNTDEWFRKTEIAEQIDYATGTLSKSVLGSGPNPGPLVLMGIAEMSDREQAMPRYRLTDSAVVEFLQEYDGYPLQNLFETRATQKLTKFWLMYATPDNAYTPYKIKKVTGLSNRGCTNNLDTFVKAGIIEKDELEHKTEYSLIKPNTTYDALIEIGNLLSKTYEKMQNKFNEPKISD